MPDLKPETVGELIMDTAEKYRETFMQELEDMTKIVDPNNTIKSPEVGEALRATLT